MDDPGRGNIVMELTQREASSCRYALTRPRIGGEKDWNTAAASSSASATSSLIASGGPSMDQADQILGHTRGADQILIENLPNSIATVNLP